MTETQLIMIEAPEPGCYLASGWGMYQPIRMVNLLDGFGLPVGSVTRAYIDEYVNPGEGEPLTVWVVAESNGEWVMVSEPFDTFEDASAHLESRRRQLIDAPLGWDVPEVGLLEIGWPRTSRTLRANDPDLAAPEWRHTYGLVATRREGVGSLSLWVDHLPEWQPDPDFSPEIVHEWMNGATELLNDRTNHLNPWFRWEWFDGELFYGLPGDLDAFTLREWVADDIIEHDGANIPNLVSLLREVGWSTSEIVDCLLG